VLLGGEERGGLLVRSVLPTINAMTLAGGFLIPDHEMERVRRVATASGEAIIAVFHSHPGGPLDLSDADCRALGYSEWPWVIVAEADHPGDVTFRYFEVSRQPC
jgi:proteasome lid subunit RPN8/RPN11